MLNGYISFLLLFFSNSSLILLPKECFRIISLYSTNIPKNKEMQVVLQQNLESIVS